MNYLLTLQYDGSGYHGWQRQENAVTVQKCVETAVTKLFGHPATVYGCSRTDTGVHANCFKCNFHSDVVRPLNRVVTGMNFFLPEDIAVTSAALVPEAFNARFDCVSKQYIYRIYNTPVRNPFYKQKAMHYYLPLDASFLDAQAKDFIGTHDFTAFRASGATVQTTVRTVMAAGVTRVGDEVIFSVQADGFLYNMVRIMVGTLLYISEGKIEAGTIPDIILSEDRLRAGKTAEPCGLYLNAVNYKEGY